MRAVILAIALLPAAVAGQGIADRVAQVRDGTVRLTYTAREGVCGNGRQGWTRFNRHDRDKDWVAECEGGPVHVQLVLARGRIVDVETWVGGTWSSRPAELDLGRVSAPLAAEYLLGLGVEGAIAAAVIADSAVVWPRLLVMARDPALGERVRRAAIFWVAQAAQDSATAGLVALADDGEREIREAAVFALSQIRAGDAVEALIRIARSHRDPAVRRSAIFWLGQSRDPRALTYFEEILRG